MRDWSTLKKLIWLFGSGAGGLGKVWKTASGAIASFVTQIAYPMRKLVAQINPVQDLHGQNAPYPAGGGKNKLPKGENRTTNGITFTVNDDGSVTVNGTSTATAFWGSQFTISAGTYTFSGCPTNSLSLSCDIRDAIGGSGISGISAEAGAGSTFTRTDALTAWFNIRIPSGVTVNNLVFYPQIETGSAKTSFASYSNICPISGHTGLSVEVRGKNLNPNAGVNYTTTNAIRQYLKAGTYTLSTDNGAIIGGNNQIYIRLFDAETDGNTITSGNISGEHMQLNGSGTLFYGGNGYSSVTVTLVVDCWLAVGFNNQIPSNFNALQLEVGSSASSYEPYTSGTTTTVSWQDTAGTVYGGSDEIVGGELTSTLARIVFDGSSDEDWVKYGSSSAAAYAMRISVPDFQFKQSTITAWSNYLQSIDNGKTWGNYDCFISFQNSTIVTGIRSITTVADWRAYLAQNPLEVVYLLATPTTFTHSPTQISTLEGENNVWVDTGDVEVEYLESGLPEAYTQVAGFTFNSDCYFEISGLKLRGSDTVMFSMVPRVACNVFGCYTTSDADNNYSLYVSTANNAKYLRYNGSTYKSKFASADLGQRYDISITPTGSHGFPEGQDDTWTGATFEASTDMCIGTTATNASSAKFKGDILGVFTVAGRFSGVPCKRNSDNVLGYYDMVSKQFYEPAEGTPTVVS